jgi:pimeloyl-ACP methyl ester carboxylesterase
VNDATLRMNRVPALGLVGSRDPVRPEVDRLAGVMACLEVVVLAGADHPTAFERPEFTAGLRKFLARHA